MGRELEKMEEGRAFARSNAGKPRRFGKLREKRGKKWVRDTWREEREEMGRQPMCRRRYKNRGRGSLRMEQCEPTTWFGTPGEAPRGVRSNSTFISSIDYYDI